MTQLIFDIEDVQRVRGTELSFFCSSAPRSQLTAGVMYRRMDRHDKGALGLLVLNTLKLKFSSLLRY